MADQPKSAMCVLVDKKGFSKHVVLPVPVPPLIRLPVKLPDEREETVYLFQVAEQRDGVVIYLEVGTEPRLIKLATGVNLT